MKNFYYVITSIGDCGYSVSCYCVNTPQEAVDLERKRVIGSRYTIVGVGLCVDDWD